MDRKVCFFIGHRDAPESVLKLLDDAIERHIAEYKVTTFIVGHYGNFDRMAARMLVAAKKKHPYISLLIDCDSQGSMSIALGIEQPDGLDVSLAEIMSNIVLEEPMGEDYGIHSHEEGIDFVPANMRIQPACGNRLLSAGWQSKQGFR